MISSSIKRPVLAMQDENTVAANNSRRLTMTKKQSAGLGGGDAAVKTPAAAATARTRRALGDISNRKGALASTAATATTLLKQPTTVAKPPLATIKRSSTTTTLADASSKTATRPLILAPPVAPRAFAFDDDDDIEVPAGRTWAQQQLQRVESFDSMGDDDGTASRIKWDNFFQDMDRIHFEHQKEDEANIMLELDAHVQRVLDLNDMEVNEMKSVDSVMSMSFFPQYSDDDDHAGDHQANEGYFPVGLDISF